jgi:purine-binding chemotaxis protein CheW
MSAITAIEMNTLAHARPQDKTAQGVDAPREFLTFCIGAEEYGIDILRVQEIRSYEAPTRITGAPRFVTGVTNLRGVIVPVVDLRLRLLADARHDASTVIVVLNVHGRVVGVVVDSVSDVIEFSAEQVKPAPRFNDTVNANHIVGIASVEGSAGERMLILLDIEALLAGADIGLATSA